MGTQFLSPTMVSRKLLALAFIRQYLTEHRASPSYGEIAAHLGTNRERVRGIVKQLAGDGAIVKRAGHRAISLPGSQEEALRALKAAGWKVNEEGLYLTPPLAPVTNPPLPLMPELDDIPAI